MHNRRAFGPTKPATKIYEMGSRRSKTTAARSERSPELQECGRPQLICIYMYV